MATTDTVSMDEAAGQFTIQSLTIEDAELVEFLSQYEAHEQSKVVSEAVTIGMRAMQLLDTSKDLEFIERRLGKLEDDLSNDVEEFQEELEGKLGSNGDLQEAFDEHLGEKGVLAKRLEAAFDEDGPFVKRLNDELGEDGERIQAALDPDKDGTPINRLEKRIKEEIESVREKIVEEEAEADIRSRTYLKGGDFEDSVEQILAEIVRQTPNNVEYTGDKKGELGREVGDFVVRLADTGQNIVVETKTESYSTQKIKDEMEDAIQNRDAAYGIFITDTLENLPRTKTGWFHEFAEQNTIVVALSEMGEEDIEPGYLRIAFNWARMRTVQSYAELGEGFDPEKLQSELNDIEGEISRFKSIRGQCTEIRKSRERIEETLTEIERNIQQGLGSIEAELIKAE